MEKYILSLSDSALIRFYFRIWDRIGYGGRYGWDWPTLRACYPQFAEAIQIIKAEGKRRGL